MLFRISSCRSSSKLYVSTVHDQDVFRELIDEYWLPAAGRLAFHPHIDAACPEDTSTPDTEASIYLDNVALHTKKSYYRFFDNLREMHEKSRPGTPAPKIYEPPAKVSFDRPSLVLNEHEAEDPAKRCGAGFTVCSAYVCLPKPLRDRIASDLMARPQNRLIVVGYNVESFPLPRRRQLDPNSSIEMRVWTFEVDRVEIKVF